MDSYARQDRPDEVIERGEIVLRRYREDDLDAIFAAVTESAGHLSPWLSWAADYTRESAEEFLAGSAQGWDDGTAFNYAITTGGLLVGGIGMMPRIGPGGLEIGYWVHQDRTGRGVATAAARALTEAAFGLPGVGRVEIKHDLNNAASGQVPRKLGYARVGTAPGGQPLAPGECGTSAVWRKVRPAAG